MKTDVFSSRAAVGFVAASVTVGVLLAGPIATTLFLSIVSAVASQEWFSQSTNWRQEKNASSGSGVKTLSLIVSGFVYLIVACGAFVWLHYHYGFWPIFWLTCCVVATDVGALVFGRAIGGPKLALKISPNKTLAGLMGGVASSVGISLLVVSALAAWCPDISVNYPAAGAFAAIFAFVAQGGDLMLSFFKRKFDVKDWGTALKSHGGVLDRIDGHMPCWLLLAVVMLVGREPPYVW